MDLNNRARAGEAVNTVTLASGELRCVLRADLGGSVTGLWLGDDAVLRSRVDAGSARESGCFALAPFSNRLAHARLRWGGEWREVLANFPPEPHAMHGIAWQRPWHMSAHDATGASMRLDHAADSHWPFDFRCEQHFDVLDGALSVRLRLTNTGRQACPAGIGWHPYVVKRPGAHVHVPASGMWETGMDSLPTRHVASDGLDTPCDALSVNHAFDTTGPVTLRDERLEVRISSSLGRLIASTQPAKDFIALEPVSHVPDSFNHDDPRGGTVVLAPGGTLSAWMRVEARHRR